MYARHILDFVIRPTLSYMAEVDHRLHSVAAEQLLLGTGYAESNWDEIRQRPQGPARSPFQIEVATALWLRDWLYTVPGHERRMALATLVMDLESIIPEFTDQLAVNLCLACAYARLRYWVVPIPLPEAGDILGMAGYYYLYWATSGSKATLDKFIKPFERFVLPLYS